MLLRRLILGFAAVFVCGVSLAASSSEYVPRSAAASDLQTTAVQRGDGDSVLITVFNGMPHPMTLAYDSASKRTALGVIESLNVRLVTIRGILGDSVTVWATNDSPAHEFSQTFPTHSGTPLKWSF